jgi:hypothetical protein
MAHPENQPYWFSVAGACGAGGVAFLTLAGTLASSNGHLNATGLLAIIAYILWALAVVCFVAGVRRWRFPLASGDSRAGSLPAPSSTAWAALPPPINVILVCDQDGDRLRLVVVNQGASARFSAEVVDIRDDRGNPLLGPSSWQIPWLADGSVAPREILQAGRGILDFAHLDIMAIERDLRTTKWVSNAHWWFSSLPHAIGFSYRPVRDRAELEAQRFRVTVRIIRAEPPDSTDRHLGVGYHGFDLVCESLD